MFIRYRTNRSRILIVNVMSETKTYVFPEGNSGGNGMLAMLAPLLQQKGIDPNLLLTMNRNSGFGGEGGWFIWVIFLFFLMGWGRNGWGGYGSNGGGIENQINNDYGRGLLMQAINGNGQAINSLASNLNCSVGQIQNAICSVQSQIQGVGNQVGMSGQQIINAIQAGNTSLAQQLANCCCEQRLSICQQTNTLQNAITQGNYMLRDSNAANTNAILDKLDAAETRALQDKLDALREKNSTLLNQLNNEHQTAAIVQSQAQFFNPLNAQLTNLQKEVDAIKCKLPETTTVPYSPVVAVPTCVAAAYGYGFNASPYSQGFWG